MNYNKPEEIEITLAHDISGFDAASRAAIIDNAQCVAFITLWMVENDYTNCRGFVITQEEVNYMWRNITVSYFGTRFFTMKECRSGGWVVALGGDGSEATAFARLSGQLGCDF